MPSESWFPSSVSPWGLTMGTTAVGTLSAGLRWWPSLIKDGGASCWWVGLVFLRPTVRTVRWPWGLKRESEDWGGRRSGDNVEPASQTLTRDRPEESRSGREAGGTLGPRQGVLCGLSRATPLSQPRAWLEAAPVGGMGQLPWVCCPGSRAPKAGLWKWGFTQEIMGGLLGVSEI